jgi:hypothetical protein
MPGKTVGSLLTSPEALNQSQAAADQPLRFHHSSCVVKTT